MGVLNPDYSRFGPLVRRRIRQFFAIDERPDDALLEFFERSESTAPPTTDMVWALATRFCLRRVRESGRRTLLAVPLVEGSWADQADARAAPGFRDLTRTWRDLDAETLEMLVYAELDGMSAGQIGELIGRPRAWVNDQMHARAGRIGT
jgi:DNA-directed RNA polymerase specialized sigma24 family protein